MRKNQKSNLVIVLALFVGAGLILGAAGILSGNLSLSSIIPGAEGLNMGLHGFQAPYSQTTFDTSESLPSGYAWVRGDPYNAILIKNQTRTDGIGSWTVQMKLGVEVSSSWHDDPVRTITYFVKTGETATTESYRKVVGQLVPYYVTIQVYDVPGSGTAYFEGEDLSFVLETIKWNQAVSDPDNPTKSSDAAYSIPVGVWIDDYQLLGFKDGNGVFQAFNQNAATFAQLSPSLEGRYITLYGDESMTGTLADLYTDPGTLASRLNSSLAGDPTPDDRFQQQVFFPVTLVKYGTYTEGVWILGTYREYYPSVQYDLKVMYLQLGEFTYTIDKQLQEEEIPGWDSRNSTVTINFADTTWGAWMKSLADFWAGVQAWAGSPLAILGMFLLVAAVLVVAIIIFLFFTGPGRAINAAVEAGRRR